MTMVTMIGEHRVFGMVHGPHHRHGGQLFADTGVRGSRNQAAGELIENQLLA